MNVKVRIVYGSDHTDWLRMRACLWPALQSEHAVEIDRILLEKTENTVVFVAERVDGNLGGFLEAGIRAYAEGCSSSPVGYIEGLWVDPDLRRSGVGTRLVSAAEQWARGIGLTEMASDSDLLNTVSHAAHEAFGYTEVERIVCFKNH